MAGKRLERYLVYLALVLMAVVVLFPLALMFRISLIEPKHFFDVPVSWFAPVTVDHYRHVLIDSPFPKYLANSLIVSLATTAIVMFAGTLAAFALARHRAKNKDGLLFFVLSTRMGPPVVFAVPMYVMMINMNMIDSRLGLILLNTFANLAFAIWLMYGFFKDTPPEVEEAAMLDGLGEFGVFTRISLPMVTSGLVATATLVFIMTWNEFFYALIMTRDVAKTFPAQVPSFFGAFAVDWGGMFAASWLGILIPLIFGMAVRKYLARGLTMGFTQ
ncbi:MAG: carbohydrate ABC transporter permease [Limnochordaceae bacterium]|nr:carbohydrate ABC transporter permease [Limnochordaceae bacterium]